MQIYAKENFLFQIYRLIQFKFVAYLATALGTTIIQDKMHKVFIAIFTLMVQVYFLFYYEV